MRKFQAETGESMLDWLFMMSKIREVRMHKTKIRIRLLLVLNPKLNARSIHSHLSVGVQ